MMESEGITELLIDWSKGDQAALEKLMPLVYDELRRLASNYLRRERATHTLQPTALVNEAYLKLVDQRNAKWQNRALHKSSSLVAAAAPPDVRRGSASPVALKSEGAEPPVRAKPERGAEPSDRVSQSGEA